MSDESKLPTDDEVKKWLLKEGDFSWFQFAHALIIRQERTIECMKEIRELEMKVL